MSRVAMLEADQIGDPLDDTRPGENPFLNNKHFRTLGVDGDVYFFVRKGGRYQVLPIRTGGLTMNALLSLAPMIWWEKIMVGDTGQFKKDAAVGFLMEAAESVGIFDPTFMRGRGAWLDQGRLVVHLGDRLLVDGKAHRLDGVRSEFLYTGGRRIAAPASVALTSTEGEWLLKTARSFSWERPASGTMLAGWIMLAPLCGALQWRPHVWITGSAGSGKSSIVSKFVRPLLPAGMPVFANGDSSEAGIRQELRSDALPILIDESESDEASARTKMERVLTMLRQSSSDTGAQTYRGTVGGASQSFHVRSMALLASIGVGLQRQQDLERVTVLRLKPKRKDGQTNLPEWPEIRRSLNQIARDEEISARLFRRSMDMSAVIVRSIDVFTEAAAAHFGTAREGDQYGALLAGAWCLTHDRAPTVGEASAEIASYDWTDFQGGKVEEQDDLLATFLGRSVLVHGNRVTVGKLVARADAQIVAGIDMDPVAANAELHNFGMKVKDGFLWIHPRNEELARLMRETRFATDLRGRLLRVPGADTYNNVGIRIGAVSTSGLRIPLHAILGDPDDVTF